MFVEITILLIVALEMVSARGAVWKLVKNVTTILSDHMGDMPEYCYITL